jgi:DNA-binding CsgD family transcriptional regulator
MVRGSIPPARHLHHAGAGMGIDAAAAAAQLSERERQVAERYVEGLSHKEIARELGISPATVRTHLNTVYRKLEVTSRIQLLHRLRREAPIKPSDERQPVGGGLAEEAAPPVDPPLAGRRLLAILAADVVGYARLIEADEGGTIARLKRVRAEVVGPLVAGHRGRVVKLTGDGVLVAFESTADAVACAVEVQETLERRNATYQRPSGSRSGSVSTSAMWWSSRTATCWATP